MTSETQEERPGPSQVRAKRIRASASSDWLSTRMRDSLLLDYEEIGIESPVIAARRLGDVAQELDDVVSLSAGGMLWRSAPAVVRDAIADANQRGLTHFPGVGGLRPLRQAIARKLRAKSDVEADPDSEIIPVIGAQMSIDGVMRILVNPGDDVLLIDPEYASIEPVIRMNGGRVIHVPLIEGRQRWEFDVDQLGRRVTPQTKLFVFSNGNNPTGVLYRKEQLQAIADLAIKHDFFVFADEEYEELVFDGLPHISIASLEGMRQRTVTAYSFSKAYSMSGLRIGYMVADSAVIDHMYNLVRFIIQATGFMGQMAALAVLSNQLDDWWTETLRELHGLRDFGVRRLNEIPGVSCATPEGCYFLFPDIRAFGQPSITLAEYLLREGKVSVAPGAEFGPAGEGHIRVSPNVGMKGLTEGLDRLERALQGLSSHAS